MLPSLAFDSSIRYRHLSTRVLCITNSSFYFSKGDTDAASADLHLRHCSIPVTDLLGNHPRQLIQPGPTGPVWWDQSW